MEENFSLISLAIQIGIPLALLLLGYFAGTAAEQQHFRSIRQREQLLRRLPAINLETPPPSWNIDGSGLVSGSVVVSLDYFKRFLANLRNLFGGRLASYESLLDRARREAILRLKEDAKRQRFDAVLNVRLETSSISSGRRDGKGIAGVEILAFGTGVKRRSASAA